MHKRSSAIALAILISISSGCYHHHLRANGERVNSSPFRKTLTSPDERKRVVPPPDGGSQGASSADCQDNGLHEVGVTSSWKYAAGTVFSFGRWSRVKVEWFCAKEPPVIGPTPQPPAAVAGQPAQNNFTKRTVHAVFWGGLQQNLLPPAPPGTSKTPASCKSMRQVKLPMNYGYAFITVATLGVWSPTQVAWQCKE